MTENLLKKFMTENQLRRNYDGEIMMKELWWNNHDGGTMIEQS